MKSSQIKKKNHTWM